MDIRYKAVMVFLCLLMLTSCSLVNTVDRPVASHGILDLSQWDFNQDGNIKIDGHWEFYWNRLLSYHDLTEEQSDYFGKVPSPWNKYEVNGKKLPYEGFATYRLYVQTDLPVDTTLGIRIDSLSSAYKLYVNDHIIASNGVVATVAAGEIGEYRPQVAMFDIPSSDFEIIIQVSNHHYAKGGFWYSIVLGSFQGVMDYHYSINTKIAFLLGVLIIIGFLYFSIYIFCRELKYTLYFAVVCFLMSILIHTVTHSRLINFLFEVNFQTLLLIWYSSTLWLLFFIVLYIHELFPSKFSKAILKISLVGSVLSQLFYLLLPSSIYTRSGLVNNSLGSILLIFIIIIISIGIKQGKKDGWFIIFSIVVLSITYNHDILYRTNSINHEAGETFYVGVFVFVLIEVIIQGYRIKMYHDNKTAAELAYLQAQIKPHFVYNTLNTFISISRTDIDKAVALLINFSTYLRKNFDFKSSNQLISLKHDLELVSAYLGIQKARFEDRLEVVFDIEENLDIKIPCLVLQPIIENAVIHGVSAHDNGGRIDVSIKKEGGVVIFRVKDTGVGIEKDMMERVLREESMDHIGIANIQKRLHRLYGQKLKITSTKGVGTEVVWYIPCGNGLYFKFTNHLLNYSQRMFKTIGR